MQTIYTDSSSSSSQQEIHVFQMNEAFMKAFNFTGMTQSFVSHKQLDLFIKSLLEIHPEVDIQFPEEWKILKSIDRSFWKSRYYYITRSIHTLITIIKVHIENEDDTNFIPDYIVDYDEEFAPVLMVGCPFNDPKDTYSIRFLEKYSNKISALQQEQQQQQN
jgi:hypothetical protein